MKLYLGTPLGSILNCEINKITVECLDGYHTLLPRHVDFVSALKPGIVIYTNNKNEEKYVACHQGIVVKRGTAVTITTHHAVLGNTLDELKTVILQEFKRDDEKRKELNSAMARLELGLLRGFKQLKDGEINDGI